SETEHAPQRFALDVLADQRDFRRRDGDIEHRDDVGVTDAFGFVHRGEQPLERARIQLVSTNATDCDETSELRALSHARNPYGCIGTARDLREELEGSDARLHRRHAGASPRRLSARITQQSTGAL